MTRILTNYSRRATDKKEFEEKLQEARHRKHDKIKHRRWEQEEREFDKYLEEELRKLGLDEDDSIPTFP